jgi:hypothetical protein
MEALGEADPRAFSKFLDEHSASIEMAVAYLMRHISKGLFYEFPPPDTDRFCLYATYWKDSVLESRSKSLQRHFDYPITYGLIQFIAARGLMSAGRVLGDKSLTTLSHHLYLTGIGHFMTQDHFRVAESPTIDIMHESSDELQALAFIPRQYRKYLPLAAMKHRAKGLETNIGYACSSKAMAGSLVDKYHGYDVWPFEQALIHYGATKFKLHHQAKVANRVVPHIGSGTELLQPGHKVVPAGNSSQLWSTAASVYFHHSPRLLSQRYWL